MNNEIIEKNPWMELALELVLSTDEFVFLSGKAGTGKTTFLQTLKKQNHKKTVFLAPTGVAAIQMGGGTIHSFFQLSGQLFLPTREIVAPHIQTPQNVIGRFPLHQNKRKILETLELIVIDEASMLRADLLDGIDVVLRHYRKKNSPFGGVQMLFVGDLFQLPPVLKEEEQMDFFQYYQSPFFLDAKALQNKKPIWVELEKIYRQKDLDFIQMLNRIRVGKPSQADLDFLSSKLEKPKQNDTIVLCTHNQIAEKINREKLAALPDKNQIFTAKIEGDFPKNTFPSPLELVLKKNAQVMFNKNDKQEVKRFYNGKIGTVVGFGKDSIKVAFPAEKQEIWVQAESWPANSFQEKNGKIIEKEIGKYTQFPLQLAFAISIHKSQGITLDRAYIDAGAAFAPGQVYVALSRLRSMNGLFLKTIISKEVIKAHPAVLGFLAKKTSLGELEQKLDQRQQTLWQENLLLPFENKNYRENCEKWLDFVLLQKNHFPQKIQQFIQNLHVFCTENQKTKAKFYFEIGHLVEIQNKEKLTQRLQAATHYFLNQQQSIFPILKELISFFGADKKTISLENALVEIENFFTKDKEILPHLVKQSQNWAAGSTLSEILKMPIEKAPIFEAVLEKNEEKKPKLKNASIEKTLIFFKAGHEIEKIALLRDLTLGTIENHLFELTKLQKINPQDWIEADVIEQIADFFSKNGKQSYAIYKEKFPEISYPKIKTILECVT